MRILFDRGMPAPLIPFLSGHFHDADELIEKALDALDEQATAAAPATATGAVVLAAWEARPYPDIDLTPPRVRLTNVRDVAL
jgi:hypothetical protein